MSDRRRALSQRVLQAGVFVAGLALCALHAGAAAQSDRDAPPGAGRILDVRAHRFIDEATLVARIAAVRYRLLGEIHDNPAHHRLRAGLIARIVASGRRPAVVMEQLELVRDESLVEAQRRGADADALADAGGLDKRGWRWPLHAPLIEAARAAGLPLHGGGLPVSALRAEPRDASAANAAWRTRLAEARWGEREEAALRKEIEGSHCGRIGKALVPRMAQAQRWRDAAMAQAVVRAATPDGSILIAGDGHVRRDLGVPRYLPPEETVSVGFVETPDAPTADDAVFDYVWYTDAAPREDPCAAFAAPRAR